MSCCAILTAFATFPESYSGWTIDLINALFLSPSLPEVSKIPSSSNMSSTDAVDAGQYSGLATDKLVSPSSMAQSKGGRTLQFENEGL